MNFRLLKLAAVLVLALFTAFGCAGNTEKKPVPKNNNTPQTAKYETLMEEAGADPFKNGCVSCHKKTGDVDRSLPAYVKKIQGHPDVKESTVNACYFCHEAQKKPELYKRFVRGMHKIHWKSETFYEKNGRCYSCHTVESNGVSGLKEYPLAGYRTNAATQTTGDTGQQKAKTETNKTDETNETKKQPETKQDTTEKSDGDSTTPNDNKPNEGLAVPQSGNADAELPVPTP